jgi:hypothetical protein
LLKKTFGKFVKGKLPSADTFGRTFAKIDLGSIRYVLKEAFNKLKRNKAIEKISGFYVAVIDGHEDWSSFVKWYEGCCERKIKKGGADVTQYYHRNVTCILITPDKDIPLDAEEQIYGEGETICAARLFKRLMKEYPQAFNLVLCDSLYATAPFIKLVLKHSKHIIAVLKDERREVMKDADGIFKYQKPLCYEENGVYYQVWDEENFSSWESLGIPIRVVKSAETRMVKNPACKRGKKEPETTTWYWITTLTKEQLPTRAFVVLAHKRWRIENNGFKELVHTWHADHVYKHDPNAIMAFWLMIMLAYMIVHAFVERRVNKYLRESRTFDLFTKEIMSAFIQYCSGSA